MTAQRPLITGIVAGMISVMAFTLVHDLFISDIWFSLIPMTIAGAVCGLCLAWSYRLLFGTASVKTWVIYNLIYVGAFVILGIVSLVVYEPVTTVAAVIASNEAPDELIEQALPLTVVFILGASLLLGWLFARQARHFVAILVTTTVLTALLGMNISILGLVEIPVSAFYLIAEFFGLILVLAVVFMGSYWVLEQILRRPSV